MQPINLSRYDSSAAYPDLMRSINHAKNNKLNLNNFSYKINFDNKLIVDDQNVLYQYRGLLSQYLLTINVDKKFYYKPELLAKEIYGTVDLWYLIMWFNDIPSIMDFNKPKCKVFNPANINVINQLLNNYKREIAKNKANIPLVEDLTLTPIKVKEI